MLNRVAGAWINQVRVALPIVLKEITVIARGGDTRVSHRQRGLNTAARTGIRALHRNPPRVSSRAHTPHSDLAAHLQHKMGNTEVLKCIGPQIHGIAFGQG